jgi:hypothetical protein
MELQLKGASYEDQHWYLSFVSIRADSGVGHSCSRGKEDAR